MNEIACPLCASAETRFYADVTDFLLKTTDKSFSLHQCGSCEILFISPRPREEELKRYYPTGYWWSEPGAALGFVQKLRKRLESVYRRTVLRDHIRFVLKAVRTAPDPPGSVTLLDVGCSGGTLLHELSRRGISVRGLDFSEEAVVHARRVYNLECAVGDLQHPPWPEARYSVVTAFHVLEHVPEPRAFLHAAAGILVEGGKLVLQVPNIRSWQFFVFGRRWYGLDPPRHLIDFSDRALVRLLEDCGFVPLREKHFSWRDDAAALVSSLFPSLDPLSHAAGLGGGGAPVLGIFRNFIYFLLLLVAIPFVLGDALSGRGATIMIEAVAHATSSRPKA